jgi:coenzyme PQQ precursor peptide PqqA
MGSDRPNDPQQHKETAMPWNTPTVVEIAVGMEINAYACAELTA